MVNKNDLSVIYTESMQNHSEGHALYKPVSALKLRPAVLGYFDRDGDWQTVLDLADQNALRLGNWLKLELTVGERETGSTIWGPKCSEHVRDINASIRAMANIPAVPLSGAIEARFRSLKGRGAILLTDPPVHHHQAGNEKVFINWMSDNMPNLLSHPIHGEMVKKFGAWIITKTYTTTRRGLAVLTSSEKVVDATLGFTAASFGHLTPSVEWWSRASDSTWEIHSEPAGVVVFMSGVEFRPRFMSKTKLKAVVEISSQSNPTSRLLRAGHFDTENLPPITIPGGEDDENAFCFAPAIVGERTPSLVEH